MRELTSLLVALELARNMEVPMLNPHRYRVSSLQAVYTHHERPDCETAQGRWLSRGGLLVSAKCSRVQERARVVIAPMQKAGGESRGVYTHVVCMAVLGRNSARVHPAQAFPVVSDTSEGVEGQGYAEQSIVKSLQPSMQITSHCATRGRQVRQAMLETGHPAPSIRSLQSRRT